MKGQNELRLCPNEMMRAVEYYLNEVHIKEPIEVWGVKQHSTENGDPISFVIQIREK